MLGPRKGHLLKNSRESIITQDYIELGHRIKRVLYRMGEPLCRTHLVLVEGRQLSGSTEVRVPSCTDKAIVLKVA